MFSSKVFALGIALFSPLIYARVQLSSNIEIDHPLLQTKRCISTEIQLDEHKFLTVCNSEDMRIEIWLLAEKESEAVIRCSVYIKNTEGNFELVLAPQLLANYGTAATIRIGENSAAAGQLKSYSWSLTAHKV